MKNYDTRQNQHGRQEWGKRRYKCSKTLTLPETRGLLTDPRSSRIKGDLSYQVGH